MESLTHVQLHPVLYLSPFDFGESNYPFSSRVSDERIHQYWKEVLSKNGFPTVEPIRKGMFYVKTGDLDEPSLEALIKHNLIDISAYRCSIESTEETEERSDEITPTSFEGGVVMTSGDRIIMTPQCCVSLQDHIEWSRIRQSEAFERIWLGHPWIYYQTQGTDIFFTRLIEKAFDGKTWRHYTTPDNTMMMDSSQSIEKEQKEIDAEDLRYRVDFAEMEQAITHLQQELSMFQNRVEIIAHSLGITNPARLADCLVNGNGEMLSYNEADVE